MVFTSSPRPWGCFRPVIALTNRSIVFPTPVGVFPHHSTTRNAGLSLPHARGGVSINRNVTRMVAPSSPRPWGCFRGGDPNMPDIWVFPTPVGVFLKIHSNSPLSSSLPHARGGVSIRFTAERSAAGSSPRPWGCFQIGQLRLDGRLVFPTPVGVFLAPTMRPGPWRCLPHARGGVSTFDRVSASSQMSSPRPWGCFCGNGGPHCRCEVFPTPVGVFLTLAGKSYIFPGLPHARGGVSYAYHAFPGVAGSSPRPWGCFHKERGWSILRQVFPTPVGVFPMAFAGKSYIFRLPHARGGVSLQATALTRSPGSSPRPWGCFLRKGPP